jgi:flavin-binding protein dodecin
MILVTHWDGSQRSAADSASLRFLAAEEDAVSVYRVTELIGTSSQSWEDAAATAVNTARKTLRDLRVAEVVEQDLQIGEEGEITFRTKLRLSFKYEDEE